MKKIIFSISLILSANLFADELFIRAIDAYQAKCQVTDIDVAYSEEVDSDYDYASYVVIMNDGGEVYMTTTRMLGDDIRYGWQDQDYNYFVDEVICK